MKLNKSYVLKHVLDSDVLIDLNSDFEGIIKLNKTSKDICECVIKHMKKDEIVNTLSLKYDINIGTLKKDIYEFIDKMVKKGIFIDD